VNQANQTDQVIKAQAELKLSYGLFNDTLDAFREGGVTKGADGQDVALEAVAAGELRDHVLNATEIWAPIAPKVLAVATSHQHYSGFYGHL